MSSGLPRGLIMDYQGVLTEGRAIEDAVTRVRATGVPVALLTSTHRVPTQVAALVDLVLAGDRVPRKPDPEAFRAAALALGVPVERCVVVDDAAANVRGARQAGAVVVAHVDVETTVAELDVLFGPDPP